MKNFTLQSLITTFAIVITMRVGYVIYDYKDTILIANAAETKSKKDNEKQDTKKIETINDKIMKIDDDDKQNNPFSSKVIMQKPQDTNKSCITGIMLTDALEKLTYLNKREAEILEQQKLLETSDRRIREQVAKLKLIKNEIIESAKLADSTIAKENKRLISIYEKMKPKDAANIFNEMTPSIAAELLRTMKEDQSSQILSKMNPKNAYNVTLSLAGGIKDTEKKYNDVKKE